jgi:CHAT domain-containing protein
MIDLGEAEPLEAAVETARKALQDAPVAIRNQGEPLAEAELRAPMEALAKFILHPLLEQIGPYEHWIISPDADLWLVPWSALPLPKGGYAVERHEVSHVVSGRDLARVSAAPVKTVAPIVMADPDFDLLPAQVQAATQSVFRKPLKTGTQAEPLRSSRTALPRVARLPGTAAEAKAIGAGLKAFSGGEPLVYAGSYALESVFKAVRRPHTLVLSTHGFFLKDQATAAAVEETTDENRNVPTTQEGELLENPLLRCGLLLAGCNHPGPSADDGVLTGLEIIGTDLRGAELVVLSACETGIGEVRNGEGVAGLRQAFQLAGAETVVASLWSVSDLETARLMQAFFEHLATGKTKSAALRAAQLERIESRRERSEAAHPFYWAAFTVTGR